MKASHFFSQMSFLEISNPLSMNYAKKISFYTNVYDKIVKKGTKFISIDFRTVPYMSNNDALDFSGSHLNYANIFEALALNYLNVYIIDPVQNKAQILKLEGYVTQGIEKEPKVFDYTKILSLYNQNRVYPEDQKGFMEKFNAENLKEYFSDESKNQLEFSYRILSKDVVEYYSGIYTRLSKKGEPLVLVAGFRNIESLILKEKKQRDEGLLKAYDSISSVYLSMYRIDLDEDTFQEIKSNDKIRNFQLPVPSARENLRHLIQVSLANVYIDEFLAFADFDTLDERMKTKKYISMEFVSIFKGWCKATIIKEEKENEKIQHVLFAIEVINEEKVKEDSLRHLADTDFLTGLLNRRSGTIKVEQVLKESLNGVFYIFDCDHFKSINDTYGHTIGDLVIAAIAECFKKIANVEDTALRLGGDEFALYVPNVTSKQEAYSIFEKFIWHIRKIQIPKYPEIKISMSAGACFRKGSDNDDFNNLYKKADQALYRSKKIEGPMIEFED